MRRTHRSIGFWIRRAVALALAAPVVGLIALWVTLPSVDALHSRAQAPSTRILDRNGRLLYEIIDPRAGHHTPVPLDRMPLRLRQATIAVEDANFYSNPGVDLIGIARALYWNARQAAGLTDASGGGYVWGGSTITQQLARLLLLTPEERTQRNLLRKAREALLALQIAQRYSKDEILALYLNEAYYGNIAYGADAAARAYFGKSVAELDLTECALLAGLPQSPVAYDPFTNPELAVQRQGTVLELMVKNGFLTAEEASIARGSPLHFAPSAFGIRAPHFVTYARNWLEREFGTEEVIRGGLIVTTTLDLGLTESAQTVIQAHLRQLSDPASRSGPDHNANNAALVSMDPATGAVVAMVGSPDFFDAGISGAVNASLSLRQPGSAIKPLTYAAAFAHVPGFTAATPIMDVRTSFPTREGLPYVPLNYDRRNHGPVSARDALATSNNIAAVSTLQRVGLDQMLNFSNEMGIHSFRSVDDYGLSLTLGGGEVRLIELAAAYAGLANAGRPVEPYAVARVTRIDGTLLYSRPVLPPRPAVLDPRAAWLVTDILADNAARSPAFGENSVLKLGRPAAVKTGTTTDWRDNWTVGYTPQLVTGVWVGNADGSPMVHISGVSGAGPIWHDFMEIAHRGEPVLWFEQPKGLVRREVCALSGLLPTAACPHLRGEWFLSGSEPTQPDTWYRPARVDAATGGLATGDTPKERQVERVLIDVPPVLREWARGQGWPLYPVAEAAAASAHAASASPILLTQPDPGSIYRLAPNLPADVQRLPLSVSIGDSSIVRVDVMLSSGERIASLSPGQANSFWQLRSGQHTLFARGVRRDGSVVDSPAVTIRVLK